MINIPDNEISTTEESLARRNPPKRTPNGCTHVSIASITDKERVIYLESISL